MKYESYTEDYHMAHTAAAEPGGISTEPATLSLTQNVVRVYDVTDDGMLRVEHVRREHGPNSAVSTTRVGVVDLEAIVAFPGDVPVIDLEECDDGLAAFGRELVA